MPGVIDFHTHVFPQAVLDDRDVYLGRDPTFRALYADPKASIATADMLVAAMDRAGIDKSVVCAFGWGAADLCRQGNDAIIDAVQRHPDRLIGLGGIAPAAGPEEALREIERLAMAGVRGLGELRPDAQDIFSLGEDVMILLSSILRELGMMVLLHVSEPVGHRYPGKEGATPERVETLLRHLTGIPTVLAHGGGGLPFYAYMPEVRTLLRDVYVDTAAFPYLYMPEVVRGLAHAIGMDRLLFASDYPLMPQERALRHVADAGLTDAEREAVLSGNAQALLKRSGVRL